MSIQLTKDSDVLICLMYKHYCTQLKNGVSRANAKMFGSSKTIQQTIAPKWSFEDVDEICRELNRAGLLTCSYADDVVDEPRLSDEGIIYMENRFKNKLDDVLNYLSKIPFLPV